MESEEHAAEMALKRKILRLSPQPCKNKCGETRRNGSAFCDKCSELAWSGIIKK